MSPSRPKKSQNREKWIAYADALELQLAQTKSALEQANELKAQLQRHLHRVKGG